MAEAGSHADQPDLIVNGVRPPTLVANVSALGATMNVAVNAVGSALPSGDTTTQTRAIMQSHELAPLARRRADDPLRLSMYQLVVGGAEIVKAYGELVDPLEQRERLREQAGQRARGDAEAMMMDEDFLLAMEHGMPPMTGVGIGIDRLVALALGRPSLRDVVLFPVQRPAAPDAHKRATRDAG